MENNYEADISDSETDTWSSDDSIAAASPIVISSEDEQSPPLVVPKADTIFIDDEAERRRRDADACRRNLLKRGFQEEHDQPSTSTAVRPEPPTKRSRMQLAPLPQNLRALVSPPLPPLPPLEPIPEEAEPDEDPYYYMELQPEPEAPAAEVPPPLAFQPPIYQTEVEACVECNAAASLVSYCLMCGRVTTCVGCKNRRTNNRGDNLCVKCCNRLLQKCYYMQLWEFRHNL